MRFLVDQNIPVSAANALTARGHDVAHVRDVLRQDSPDQLIAYLAIRDGYVVLTHDKDFKNINALAPHGYKRQMKLADRIILGPTSVKAAPRLIEVIEAIEFLHQWASAAGRQFRIDITDVSIRLTDKINPPDRNPG